MNIDYVFICIIWFETFTCYGYKVHRLFQNTKHDKITKNLTKNTKKFDKIQKLRQTYKNLYCENIIVRDYKH